MRAAIDVCREMPTFIDDKEMHFRMNKIFCRAIFDVVGATNKWLV